MVWAIRRWRWDEWLRVAVGPAVALALALATFDLSWVTTLLHATGQHHGGWVNIPFWWRFAPYWLAWLCSGVTAALGLWLTARRRFDRYTLALAVSFGAVSSPYLATHHLVLPMTLAWPWLLDRHPRLALLVYLTSLTPLLRLGGSQAINWLDFVFPLVLTAALLFFYRARTEE